MAKLYIALVDTPGVFAWMIRKTIRINYIHVVLSLDGNFQEAYSVGRRNPFIPFFAGFEKEDIYQIHRAFPTARYKIYTIQCTDRQKKELTHQLRHCYRQRFRYHYCIIGLFYLLLGKPFYQTNYYTCSSFIARILQEHGILSFPKHFSLVTPRDFYEYGQSRQQDIIFEGQLQELCLLVNAHRLTNYMVYPCH